MTRGAVSKILDKLERKSLVARTPSALDSRVYFLTLTTQGRRILPGLTKIADTNDGHFFDALAPKEQVSLRRLLQKLAEVHGITRIPVD
jgi:DNA-binding MarR family transcriptional regulator